MNEILLDHFFIQFFSQLQFDRKHYFTNVIALEKHFLNIRFRLVAPVHQFQL